VKPHLTSDLVDKPYYRRVPDPAWTTERTGIDLVNDEVETTPAFILPELPRRSVDPVPTPPPDDLISTLGDIPLGLTVNRAAEQCYLVSSKHPFSGHVIRVHLGSAGKRVGEIPPVVDKNPH
jgi:hypothetical protein